MTMIVELGPTLDAAGARVHADAVLNVSQVLAASWNDDE
jgi:hypothetical protein